MKRVFDTILQVIAALCVGASPYLAFLALLWVVRG